MKSKLAIALLLLTLHSTANSDDSVNWVISISSYPSAYLTEQGKIDSDTSYGKAFDFILDEIGGSYVASNAELPRMMSEAKDGVSFCSPGLIKKPDREEVFYYSAKPRTIALPHQLFMKRRTWKKLGSPRIASLADTLMDSDWTVATETARSYGAAVDAVLATLPEKNVYRFSFRGNDEIKSVVTDRADMVVTWPPEKLADGAPKNQSQEHIMSSIAQLEGDERIVSVELAEMESLVLLDYVVCSKTPQGRKWIKRIDQAISKAVTSPSYREMSLSRYSYDPELLSRAALAFDQYVLDKSLD